MDRILSFSTGDHADDGTCHARKTTKVPSGDYYSEYHGHTVEHLEKVRTLLEDHCDSFVYLMGDSTMDNKHWIFLETKETSKTEALLTNDGIASRAINGYEEVLDPPRMVRDVSYWMNKIAFDKNQKVCTIMAAIEESTVASRNHGTSLLPQDDFIARHIRSEDILVVSMGGNDLALRPTEETALALQSLAKSPPADILNGTAPGLSHVLDIFHTNVERILSTIIEQATNPPKAIIVCGLYFLDEASENPGMGWADPVLEALGYNHDPSTIQTMLRTIFREMQTTGFPQLSSKTKSTTTIKLFPMFEVLDGKTSEDYLERVEPSIQGGRKIAEGLMDLILL